MIVRWLEVTKAEQDGSITTVDVASIMMAGPFTIEPEQGGSGGRQEHGHFVPLLQSMRK